MLSNSFGFMEDRKTLFNLPVSPHRNVSRRIKTGAMPVGDGGKEPRQAAGKTKPPWVGALVT